MFPLAPEGAGFASGEHATPRKDPFTGRIRRHFPRQTSAVIKICFALHAPYPAGMGKAATFRRVVLPNLLPAIASGMALSFARAVGEFGSTVLISGNLPFKTQVASVYIFGQVENDNRAGAAAVSTVLRASSAPG